VTCASVRQVPDSRSATSDHFGWSTPDVGDDRAGERGAVSVRTAGPRLHHPGQSRRVRSPAILRSTAASLRIGVGSPAIWPNPWRRLQGDAAEIAQACASAGLIGVCRRTSPPSGFFSRWVFRWSKSCQNLKDLERCVAECPKRHRLATTRERTNPVLPVEHHDGGSAPLLPSARSAGRCGPGRRTVRCRKHERPPPNVPIGRVVLFVCRRLPVS